MQLESPKATVFKPIGEVYNFLIDVNNFEKLMPDNTEKFEVDGDSFLFALSGMPEIKLILKEKQPTNKIVFAAASSKLNFTLTIVLDKKSDNATEGQLLFKGEFNPMMAMMVKKPLTSFINTLGNNLQKI